jgi:hypothetical protein
MDRRTRNLASLVLVVVGAVLLLAGVLTYYARSQVLDQEAFGDHADAALRDSGVRHLVSREIVVNLIDRGSTDLVAARPLLESVVDAALNTPAFRRIFRKAAIRANRVLFVRGQDEAALDLSAAAELVTFGVRSVSPRLAKEIPEDFDPGKLALRRGDFTTHTLQVADHVRLLGILLPLLAVIALLGAVVVAPDRRVGLLRAGVAAGAVGALLAIALAVLRARTLAGVIGEDEVTDAEVRSAVGGILDAYFGDLFAWSLLLGLGGLVVAGAAAALEPGDVEHPLTRLRRRLLQTPATARGRALRGALALALGAFVALNPLLAVQIGAILAGAWLAFFGTSELLVVIQGRVRSAAEAHREERARRRALVGAGLAAVGAVGVIVTVILLATSGGPPRRTAAATASTGACNGSRDLCGLRLNEVVFAGTHNSFSAADSPGWYIANQRRTIDRQLRDGIRLFLLDPHWGVATGPRHVRTDFASEGRDRNRVAKALPPRTLLAAERVAGSVGLGHLRGHKRDVWLCHTVCELGATRMVDALSVIRSFLQHNPREVVILFLEPYVPPREITAVFERAGLDRYVATLHRDEPLPTLGGLVRTGRRVVVFTEKDADGTVPWYLDGFSFVQDTPLKATRPEQLSCRRARGTADSPLLMLNHWADVFPPRLRANRPFQTETFLLRRAHRCARRRGLPVNLIAVDYYDQGGLLKAVTRLNREQVRRVRRERQLASRTG